MAPRRIYHTPQWRAARRAVLDRDGYRCQSCGKAGRLEVDHIKPLKSGGKEFELGNLQALCRPCHFAKTSSENRTPLTAAQRDYDRILQRLISEQQGKTAQ